MNSMNYRPYELRSLRRRYYGEEAHQEAWVRHPAHRAKRTAGGGRS